ncbi:uncharacterized protein PG998_008140 [Apiospora kogelbergensis]|uniref:uncharacterized protein n=1 Tax=Apiospora kogelbergensis TaxID=1337665 RepID=UPI00313255CC
MSEGNTNETATVPDKSGFVTSTNDGTESPKNKSLGRRTERSLLQKALMANYHTLLELRCYAEFVEKRIRPSACRYENPDRPGAHTIRYQDLWYLFQPGELIYTNNITIRPPNIGGLYPKEHIGRLSGLSKPDATSTHRCNKPAYLACTSRKSRIENIDFMVRYYSLDYNGNEFGRVECFTIVPFFEGLRDVTRLPIYPLRFHKEQEALKKSFLDTGSKFRDAVFSRHMGYCGWTRPWVTQIPPPPTPARPANSESFEEAFNTNQALQPRGTTIRDSRYIESDVVIDVVEATRASQEARNRFPVLNKSIPAMHACQDLIEIIRWSDKKRTERLSVIQDRTQVEDAISYLEVGRLRGADRFVKPQKHPEWTTDDILLLPQRVHAYALRERKFFEADVRRLRRLQTDTDAFGSLKIDPGHIRIVKAVVSSHFQRKEMEEMPEFTNLMDQDLIRGKGRGLVILLHGAPGVGKTATAEAVALWHKRPLFVITCGDLGFTPQGVESSLGEIFRLAHLWNCVLLLDEADVFLSQRETNSLQRNALVSVFLRVLEYYNGILFLTTNRVGTLDEAFKSRVRLSLYYPALGKTQTEEITRMNLVRLRTIEQQRAKATGKKPLFIEMEKICRFSTEHWDRHEKNDGEGRWNGRQIRNAVQIAASLAWYDRKTSTDPGAEELPPILDERHFQTVEKTMTLFEGYMTKTRGGTDTFISQQRSERYDRFKGGDSSSWEEGRPTAPGPDLSSSARGGQAVGGCHNSYQSRQRTPQQQTWSRNPMPNAAGPANPFMAGPSYSLSPSQPYGQNIPHYQQQQVQTGYGGQASQQPAHINPSPALINMHTDQGPQMPQSSAAGTQCYSQNQMPHLSPHSTYAAPGAIYTPEWQQGTNYQPGDSTPRSSHHTGNNVLGSIGAMNTPSMNPDGDNRPLGQPLFQQQG